MSLCERSSDIKGLPQLLDTALLAGLLLNWFICVLLGLMVLVVVFAALAPPLQELAADMSCCLLLHAAPWPAVVPHWGTGLLPLLCCSAAVRPAAADAAADAADALLSLLQQCPAGLGENLRLLM
jgi:hypothetical protein